MISVRVGATLWLALCPAQVSSLTLESSPLVGCAGFECIRQYVALPDDTFAWHDTGVRIQGTVPAREDLHSDVNWTGHVLNVTSQTWQPGNVDWPVWWHTVVLIVPDNLERGANSSNYATLSLDFGINSPDGHLIRIDNREAHEEIQDRDQASIAVDADNLISRIPSLVQSSYKAAYLAAHTRALAASVLNLPNAYETFRDDQSHMRRAADFQKSYTYLNFLKHPDEPERIMELPVAKAVVRVMDALTAYTTTSLPSGRPVSRFGVTGYSKLGTATFVQGALDPRVEVIVPSGITVKLEDFLPPGSSVGLLSALGVMKEPDEREKPSSMVRAYAGLVMKQNVPEFKLLGAIVDPLSWKDNLKSKPVLYSIGSSDALEVVVNALGLESKRLNELHADGLRFSEIPNCIHEESLVRTLPSAAAFFRGFLLGKKPPMMLHKFMPARQELVILQASEHIPTEVRKYKGPVAADSDFKKAMHSWTNEVVPEGVGDIALKSWTAKTMPGLHLDEAEFVTVEYEWPEPGYSFVISTPPYRNGQAVFRALAQK